LRQTPLIRSLLFSTKKHATSRTDSSGDGKTTILGFRGLVRHPSSAFLETPIPELSGSEEARSRAGLRSPRPNCTYQISCRRLSRQRLRQAERQEKELIKSIQADSSILAVKLGRRQPFLHARIAPNTVASDQTSMRRRPQPSRRWRASDVGACAILAPPRKRWFSSFQSAPGWQSIVRLVRAVTGP